MKFLLVAVLLLSAHVSYAAKTKWNAQEVSKIYKTTKTITLEFDDEKYKLPRGTQFELIEVSDLNMIKVHLHKYKIDKCPSKEIETDLQLVNVRQSRSRKTSVGVNLTKGCVVEIFVDMKEYSTFSFLK